MTDDEIRIAVAKACGWHTVQQNPMYPHDRSRLAGFWGEDTTALCGIPNYPADLNACASFREHLDKREQDLFAAHLGELTGGKRIDFGAMRVDCTTAILWATARQRCEAFLKVKGLWKP